MVRKSAHRCKKKKVSREVWYVTIFDEVVLRQTLQAGGACESLREEETNGGSESVPPIGLPPVDVLQERRKRAVLQRFLEVFVSDYGVCHSSFLRTMPVGGSAFTS